MVKISTKVRISIIMELQAGGTLRAFARKFKMSHPGVRKIWNEFQETEFIENPKIPSRRSLLTDRDKRIICRQCIKEPFQSAKSIYALSNMIRRCQHAQLEEY